MSHQKRIFLAIRISQDLQNKIKQFQVKYNHFPVRWMDADKLHITLVPPFYVKDLTSIITQLNHFSFVPEFSIEFKHFAFGPTQEKARLIWLTGEKNKNISKLRNQIYTSLNFDLPNILLKPHVTVARFKELEDKFLNTSFESLNHQERIANFEIIETVRSNKGLRYITKHKINL